MYIEECVSIWLIGNWTSVPKYAPKTYPVIGPNLWSIIDNFQGHFSITAPYTLCSHPLINNWFQQLYFNTSWTLKTLNSWKSILRFYIIKTETLFKQKAAALPFDIFSLDFTFSGPTSSICWMIFIYNLQFYSPHFPFFSTSIFSGADLHSVTSVARNYAAFDDGIWKRLCVKFRFYFRSWGYGWKLVLRLLDVEIAPPVFLRNAIQGPKITHVNEFYYC